MAKSGKILPYDPADPDHEISIWTIRFEADAG